MRFKMNPKSLDGDSLCQGHNVLNYQNGKISIKE